MSDVFSSISEDRKSYLFSRLPLYEQNPALRDQLIMDEKLFVEYLLGIVPAPTPEIPIPPTPPGTPLEPSEQPVTPEIPIPPTPPVTPLEPSKPLEVTTIELPALPWYVAWLEPVIQWANSITESVVNFVAGLLSPIKDLADIMKNPLNLIFPDMSKMIADGVTEGTKMSLQAVKDASAHSPDFVTDFNNIIGTAFFGPVNELVDAFSKTIYSYSILDPLASVGKLADFGKLTKQIYAQSFLTGSITEACSLGQFEGLQKFIDMVLEPMGITELSKLDIVLPMEAALVTPAKQYWNSIYPNTLPSTQDLINMVVKEKLSVSDFTQIMKLQGINEGWSQKLWDAHFIAPSLGQLLTTWRRNHITTDELNKLEILVDLDPIYKTMWEDARYVDPSITEARFMFETGAIDREGVKNIIARNGLFPSDVDALTEFVVRFQERLFRRRIILSTANGYRLGVFDAERVKSVVKDAGYTEETASWVIRNEDIKREISESKVKPVKEVLVTLSLAKDAFIHGDVDEAWLLGYFQEKGYDPFEVSLAVKAFKRDRDIFLAK